MVDVVDRKTRSRMMSAIKGKNTKPEIIVRSLLHGRGFRFRLHVKNLPGKPDIVLPKYKAVIFVHGCFWHGHNCRYFKLPMTRQDFWKNKISGNQKNDEKYIKSLLAIGWRIATVWECATRDVDHELIISHIIKWLLSNTPELEIRA